MIDYTELKRLAEDAIDDSRCRHDFQMEVTPKVVLSMLAEIEQLQRDFTYIKQQRDKLQDEVKNTRTNYSKGWDECIGQRDKLRTQNQALVKEMRYIAGISNGQVKRVADQALAAQPDHSELVKDMRSFIELWKYVSPNPSAILTRAADALEGKL